LAGAKLAGVFDAVYPSQLLVGYTIGFADPVEGLARSNRMIDTSKVRLGNRRLRGTAPDKDQNQNNQRSGPTMAVGQTADRFPLWLAREYFSGQPSKLRVAVVYGISIEHASHPL
jgi:hypothetical protein